MLALVTLLLVLAWLFAAGVAAAISRVLVQYHRRRCPHGTCQRCGYDLRATPQTCPECGLLAGDAVPLPNVRRLRVMLFMPLAGIVLLNLTWPYLYIRPALLAEAKTDVMALPISPTSGGTDVRYIRVGEVCLLGDGSRIRVISDSHHNNYLTYDGSTYVNINNRIFFRPSGHCDPDWGSPIGDLSAAAKDELVRALESMGYRQVVP